MLKSLALATATVCWLSLNAFSQQNEKPPEKKAASQSYTSFKWDVSLDVYNLFANRSPGIMLRYSPRKNRAFRFALANTNVGGRRAVQYADSSGLPATNPLEILREKYAGLNMRFGYEAHLNSGRHQFFYGADLDFSYSSEKTLPAVILPMRMYDFHLVPFVGLKYRILERLSISTELSGRVGYHLHKMFNLDKTVAAQNEHWGVALVPFRFINVSYHF